MPHHDRRGRTPKGQRKNKGHRPLACRLFAVLIADAQLNSLPGRTCWLRGPTSSTGRTRSQLVLATAVQSNCLRCPCLSRSFSAVFLSEPALQLVFWSGRPCSPGLRNSGCLGSGCVSRTQGCAWDPRETQRLSQESQAHAA